MDVFEGHGIELERVLSFGVCLQLFERRLACADAAGRARLLAGSAALARPLFEEAAVDPVGQHGRISALVHGLYWLCSNLVDQAPLVLAVDDAHWADRGSLRFLLYLSERLRDLRVVLIVTVRPGKPDALRDFVRRLVTHSDARVLPVRH